MVRIRCAECVEYDLCVKCFTEGSSSGTHKPWHDYHIVEKHSYPIFSEDWGADEELSLIEGAEAYGLGNWQDIAENIGGRSKEETRDHYLKVYIDSPDYPLPDLKRDFSHISVPEFTRRQKARLEARRNAPMPLPKDKTIASVPSCHEVQGYMPGRLEFDTEYENEADIVVQDMIFEPEDNEQDINLKLTVLHIYNSRLTSRAERKRTMLTHHLLEYRRNISSEKKRSKEEKDLFNRMKPFARLMTPADFEEFAGGLLTEYQCRRQIAELQDYRRNGITSFQVAAKFKKDKANRLNMLARFSMGNAPLSSSGPARHTANSMATSFKVNGRSPRPLSPYPFTNGNDFKNNNSKKATPIDISHAADVDLLSPEEQQLCSQLRLYPKPYLAIKETLFRELLRTGGILRKRTARELIKIDVNKTAKIYEFFQAQKWLVIP